MLWYCAECNAVGQKRYFKDSCPKCKGYDVFDDEKFKGSKCDLPLSVEVFGVRLDDDCPECNNYACKVVAKKPREANYPPTSKTKPKTKTQKKAKAKKQAKKGVRK